MFEVVHRTCSARPYEKDLVVQPRCSLLRALVCVLCILPAAVGQAAPDNVAFYYGHSAPVPELAAFDWVVLDADESPEAINALQQLGTRTYCYLSVGETPQTSGTTPGAVIGVNQGWQANVMDTSDQAYRSYLMDQVERLAGAGCDGLFLDTLDSYQSVLDPADHPGQALALTETIQAIKQTAPQLGLIANRGFELLAQILPLLDALAFESFVQGWNQLEQSFTTISAAEQQWLQEQVRPAIEAGTPVIAIDYAPDHATRVELASQLANAGFTPFVSEPTLTAIGVSRHEIVPRRVVVLYEDYGSGFELHDAHILLGTILDRYGLIAEPVNVSDALPRWRDGLYVGVVAWLERNLTAHRPLAEWLQERVAANTPVAFVNMFPNTSAEFLSELGLSLQNPKPTASFIPATVTANVGSFEANLLPRERLTQALSKDSTLSSETWLSVTGDLGTYDAIAITPWGGYALTPYVLRKGYENYREWVVDPFAFFKQALQLPDIPAFDTTTENGRRILTAHIDGDGFPSRFETEAAPFSAEVILEEVLKRYPVPHTVSVIEGEVGKAGLFPELSDELEQLARRIFALPHVEAASHSYSHPFFWESDREAAKNALYGLSLPIPDYTIDLEREIFGSLNYVRGLLPDPSEPVGVFLWSGDALPSAEAVRLTNAAGAVNINGGNTIVRDLYRSITGVYPQGRMTAGGLQVYAPIMNENVYTNDWTGPFYGFHKVTQTFARTEQPRRLKPMSIYYHFYSGTKQNALRALREVYEYAMQAETTPLYLSEFAKRVQGYFQASISRPIEDVNAWHFHNTGALRTVRLPQSLGWPNFEDAQNVAGLREHQQQRYLHLSADHASVHLSESALTSPRPLLAHANAKLTQWEFDGDGTRLSLAGHVPLEFSISMAGHCEMQLADRVATPVSTSDTTHLFQLNTKEVHNAFLVCQ